MNKLAKRNKINSLGIVLLYIFLNIIALIGITILWFVFTSHDAIITQICIGLIILIILVFLIINVGKNVKELHKILRLLKSKPEYYLEINGDNIKVNALDKEYTIKFSDIERLNYSFDRPLISANFLQMYGNDKYKLNTNSEKEKSNYTMFDLSHEFVPTLKNNKKTKHGILLITTKDYFFMLPEIENVEECFRKLKELINYVPSIKENEKDENQNFLANLYNNIMSSKKEENLEYNERKFLSLINMIEGFDVGFNIEENIQYLEELGAVHYAILLKETKMEIDNAKVNNKIINGEDFAVQLFNKIKILDEKEPFYKTYLIPFAKEHLSKYIKN